MWGPPHACAVMPWGGGGTRTLCLAWEVAIMMPLQYHTCLNVSLPVFIDVSLYMSLEISVVCRFLLLVCTFNTCISYVYLSVVRLLACLLIHTYADSLVRYPDMFFSFYPISSDYRYSVTFDHRKPYTYLNLIKRYWF